MDITDPMPFEAALKKLRDKQLMPTDLGSADLRQLDAALRERALFSARTNHAAYLQDVKDTVAKLLNGETNVATARAELQDRLERYGYNPTTGFPGRAEVPPADAGSLQDLSSDTRLQLMLETNVRQCANYAYAEQGQTDQALFSFPCWELLRIYPRTVERGTKTVKGAVVPDPGQDWPSRWEKAGGEFFDGRMIARKDDDVWNRLGSSDLFDDGLDASVPPFAFNSGFGVREIDRDEAIALGVISEDDVIEGTTRDLNEGLSVAADFDPEYLKALQADLQLKVNEGRLALEK